MTPELSRRALLMSAGATLYTGRGAAEPEQEPFEVLDLELRGETRGTRRALVLVPRGVPEGSRLPIGVLLHGLGETRSEALGVQAWLKPYGLGSAWRRLQSPPIANQSEQYWSEPELTRWNASLARWPFQGFVVVCPYMPNPYGKGSAAFALSLYSDWLVGTLLPAVRERVRSTAADSPVAIAGVSLGGFAAVEVFLRKPAAFAALGSIQGAFSLAMAQSYARRIAEAAAQRPAATPVYVATSTLDPYRAAGERLAAELTARGVAARLSLRRGPHSQGWLREVGSLEVLAIYDGVLRGRLDTGA